jgi:hypothetical protein
MSEGLFAKLAAARKSLERWEAGRKYQLGEQARQITEDRIAFWTQRVAELERLIREAAA